MVSAANPLSTSPQPKFHHDNQNTGQSQYNGPQTNQTRWKYYFGNDSANSSPAIGKDGTIYIGNYDNNLYAITPKGTLKWKYKTGDGISSSPAIAMDGTIYVGSYDSNLYAINPTGTLKWKYKTGGGIGSSPAIGNDGTIYITSDYLYAINPTGTIKWKYKTGGGIWSSPAIAVDGTIYITSDDRNLYAINPNGTLKWKYKTGRGIESSPAISADGTIYIASDYLYAINPNGTLKWKYTPGGLVFIPSSPAIGKDGTIYFGRAYNYLYAINPTGTLKWKYNPEGHIICYSSPTIGNDGTIYIGSDDGLFYEKTNIYNKLFAINRNGTLKWKYDTRNPIDTSPAISSDGTLYIASWDLFAIHDAVHNITVTVNHKSGVYNSYRLPITLKSNYPATIYYTLNGKTPTDSSTIYKHPITITKDTLLKYFAIDSYGDISPIYTKGYIIRHNAPKIKATDPINGYKMFSRTGLIRILFNEKIKPSVLYKYITVKNLSNHRYVHTVRAIVGNTLFINTSKARRSNTWYQVTIPKWAVKDYYYSGNRLSTTYTLKFKTKGL